MVVTGDRNHRMLKVITGMSFVSTKVKEQTACSDLKVLINKCSLCLGLTTHHMIMVHIFIFSESGGIVSNCILWVISFMKLCKHVFHITEIGYASFFKNDIFLLITHTPF